jgi:hypothetical protein
MWFGGSSALNQIMTLITIDSLVMRDSEEVGNVNEILT